MTHVGGSPSTFPTAFAKAPEKDFKPISYDPTNFKIFLRIKGTVIRDCWLRTLLVALLSVLLVLLKEFGVVDLGIGGTGHTFIGIAMGMFLVFRTNSCYERWREGRILLGTLANKSRNLMLNVCTLIPGEEGRPRELKEKIQRLLSIFVVSIKNNIQQLEHFVHLHDFAPMEADFLLSQEGLKTIPQMVALWIEHTLSQAHTEGYISEYALIFLLDTVGAMVDAWGGLQRIRDTPTPFAYAHHIKMFLHLYCFTLPFALLDTMEYVSPVAALFITYALLGIDEIAIEMECPLVDEPNHLPVHQMCRRIGVVTLETLEQSKCFRDQVVSESTHDHSHHHRSHYHRHHHSDDRDESPFSRHHSTATTRTHTH
ncbi:membrane protein [Pelomyxa schiedti]|nr:membrane protein [Pelomyxa schiedti]